MCLISKRPRAFGRRTMLYFSLHPQHRSQCLMQKRQLNLVSWMTQITGNVFDIWVSGYRAIASDYICLFATATAKSLQSCPTPCDPVDGSPPGSPVPRILQARTLEWVAISFSNAWKWKVKVKSLSHVPWRPHGLQPTRLLRPWDFPGKSTGVGCHCLLRFAF